ncbi:MAG: hypothetical protein ACWA41_10950 [Putridiphycobacter sp.]
MKITIFFLSFFLSTFSFSQKKITLVESISKIPAISDEIFYFGLMEGDMLILDFQELKNKPIKEIEISEFGGSSIFIDFKSIKVETKAIEIFKTGIYKFRFSNSALSGRICKYKIQRVPKDSVGLQFNSTVYWKQIYDTVFYNVEEKYLASKDTSIINLTDQVSKVHSSGNINGNKTTFNFTLPKNTVSWSYYIGVDQQGQEAFEKATKDLAKYASPILSKLPGYGPLAALELNGTSYLTQLQKGEDIDYYLVMGDNVNLFLTGQPFRYLKKGKVINDFSRMTDLYRGVYHFCYKNDNAITPVSVTVKVTAIVVTENWQIREVQKFSVKESSVPYLKE